MAESNNIPWLLIPNQEDWSRTLYNIHTKETRKIDLPETRGRWICSATNGWLLTMVLSRPYAIHLLNPISKQEIELPPRSTFRYPQLGNQEEENAIPEVYIVRAITSTTPSDPNCMVLVIYGNRMHLACCKIGDHKWTHVEDPTKICNFNVMFYKGKSYATDNMGHVKLLELLHDPAENPKALRIASPLQQHLEQKYLVESVVSGDFWLVFRNLEWNEPDKYYRTVSFEVFKMDLVTKELSKVESLGDEALFLGHNDSISVLVSSAGTCRPNCIYFLDDYLEGYYFNPYGCHDMGVFDLATMRVEEEELYDRSRTWVTPFYWIHV